MTTKFFAKQPQEIQDLMARMAPDYISNEIIVEFKKHGVTITRRDIENYRKVHNIHLGKFQNIKPADNLIERIEQYINAIIEYDGDTWSNRNLGCRGAVWSNISLKMRKAGLLKATGKKPRRYAMLVSYEKMLEWYNKEINK